MSDRAHCLHLRCLYRSRLVLWIGYHQSICLRSLMDRILLIILCSMSLFLCWIHRLSDSAYSTRNRIPTTDTDPVSTLWTLNVLSREALTTSMFPDQVPPLGLVSYVRAPPARTLEFSYPQRCTSSPELSLVIATPYCVDALKLIPGLNVAVLKLKLPDVPGSKAARDPTSPDARGDPPPSTV